MHLEKLVSYTFETKLKQLVHLNLEFNIINFIIWLYQNYVYIYICRGTQFFGCDRQYKLKERGGEGDDRAEFPSRVWDGEGKRRIQPTRPEATGGVCGESREVEQPDQDLMHGSQKVHEGKEDAHGAMEEA